MRLSITPPTPRPGDGSALSVDLENGYGADPEDAALAIRRVFPKIYPSRCCGGSIEDYDPSGRIYGACAIATEEGGGRRGGTGLEFPFALTSESENHIRAIRISINDRTSPGIRECGADVLYAPGLRTGRRYPGRLRGGFEAGKRVSPSGVVHSPTLVAAGARRVSVGGSLTGRVSSHGRRCPSESVMPETTRLSVRDSRRRCWLRRLYSQGELEFRGPTMGDMASAA